MSSSSLSDSFRFFFGKEWTLSSTRMEYGARSSGAYASLGEQEDSHFLIGGGNGTHLGSCNAVLEYTTSKQQFTTHTPLPEPRYASAATAIGDGLVVTGGRPFSNSKSALVYNKMTKDWSAMADLNIGRLHHACVSTKDNKCYVLGGMTSNEDNAMDCIEELDLSTSNNNWRVLPKRLGETRAGCCAVMHPRDPHSIVVVGGKNCRNDNEYDNDDDNDEFNYLDSCEIVSLLGGEPQQPQPQLPSLTTPRAHHTLVVVEKRFLVVMGGYNSTNKRLTSVEVLDLENQQQWHSMPCMRIARSHFAAFYVPTHPKKKLSSWVE